MLLNHKDVTQSPSLFVYVPTYKRTDLLARQLSSLAGQLSSHPNQVRVLVSINDAENEEYQSIIKRYECEAIQFRENPGNLGANPNILLGFVFAKQFEFLWVLSDDDMITSNALSEIFPVLKNAPDLVHIGTYEESSSDFDITLQNCMTLPRGAGFGLISVVIFNSKIFSPYLHYGFDYLDSSFPHLAILMGTLREKKLLKMKSAIHAAIFTSEILDTHGSADYSVSSVGYGYLADFLPDNQRYEFLRQWLIHGWRGFLGARKSNSVKYYRAVGYLLVKNPRLAISLFLASYAVRIARLKSLM